MGDRDPDPVSTPAKSRPARQKKTKVIFDPADHDLPVRKKKAPESGSTAPTAAGPSSSLAASSPGFPMANAFLNQHLRIQQLPQKAPRQLVQQQQQQEQQPQLQQRQHQHQLPQQVQVQHHHQQHQQHQHHHQQQQLGSLVLQKIVKSESAGPLTKGASGGIGGGAKPGSASSGLAPAMATVTPLGAVVPAAGVGQSGPVCPRCRSGKPKVRGNQRIERLLRCSSCSVVVHPSCLDYSDSLTRKIFKSVTAWQCSSCKVCSVCNVPNDKLTMLICDSCDLGYHMVCNKPPLPKKPSGRWECFRCLKSSSMSSTAIAEEAVVASLQQQPNWATPAAAGVPVTRQCRSSQAEAPVSVEIGKATSLTLVVNSTHPVRSPMSTRRASSASAPLSMSLSHLQPTADSAAQIAVIRTPAPPSKAVKEPGNGFGGPGSDPSSSSVRSGQAPEKRQGLPAENQSNAGKFIVSRTGNRIKIMTAASLSPPPSSKAAEPAPKAAEPAPKAYLPRAPHTVGTLTAAAPQQWHPQSDQTPANWEDYEPDPTIPNVSKWNEKEIRDYFSALGFSDETCRIFVDQEIDGSSLLLLHRADVIKSLGLKLGPALKVFSQVQRLQTRRNFPHV